MTLFTLAVASSFTRDAAAQQRRPTRVPVTVALEKTLPAATPFRILRRADLDPRDVILLGPDADSTVLSTAVWQLLIMRQVQGDTAARTDIVRVRRRDAGVRGTRVLPWARRVVDDLNRTAPRTVAGVGSVPAVVIWLPPQRGARYAAVTPLGK
ncbi:MAG TPA: hypothetical protein VF705_07070 [Longimicrobium sp.]|jgi:hypothetical protein